VLSCLSRVAKVATRLRHLVFNLWWAERPVVFFTCVPQWWQVIVLLLLESLFIDCLSISDLHLSWSEVCLEINLLFWKRMYLSKKRIETITLPIKIGNWHYSSIRVIGNVVDLITEPRKDNYNYFL